MLRLICRSVWVLVYKASSCTKNDCSPRFLSYLLHSMPWMIRRTCGSQNTGWPPVFTLSLLIIREFGSHTIPLLKFASAILSSAYSTKAIALISVKCHRTRYLCFVSVLPAIDGSQHSPNLVKQRGEKSGTHQHTAPRKGRYSHAGAWKLNSHCEIVWTSFLDQSRWFFLPYLPGSGKRKQSGLYLMDIFLRQCARPIRGPVGDQDGSSPSFSSP